MENYDFCGWATYNDVRCSDGRTIRKDAFKECDGKVVPLVWNHQHNESGNILGHALLKNRPQGVYSYCTFNNTESGRNAKLLVDHGDIVSLSIYANQLKQVGSDVIHGAIREVSLVLAGANPKAYIESIISHGDGSDEEAIIYSGEPLELYHAEEQEETKEKEDKEKEEKPEQTEEKEMAENKKDKTIKEVFDTLTEEQKTVVYALIGQAIQDAQGKNVDEDDEEGENDKMIHNVFESDEKNNDEFLSHAEFTEIVSDAKRYGSMKDAFLQHGITSIDFLFPDAKNVTQTPEWVSRDTGWVTKVMGGVHHTPFSRIKSMFADITTEDARAKGYIKGHMKKEQVFALLRRTTTPTTVYKKQKLDRDDMVDITDMDVVAWLKGEMRMMLDEELARAFLIGDGRDPSSEDKINEQNIRPIMTDDPFFAIKAAVVPQSTDELTAKMFIKTAIKARKNYKGSGEPTLYTTEDVLTDMLLIEDETGRFIYDSMEKLKNVLRVKEIVTVPVMEGVTGPKGGDLMGIIVNLNDYNVGADKGGAVNMFDDFDIDYNAQKYLIETRCSGALTKPYSAIVLEKRTPAPDEEPDTENPSLEPQGE